MKSIKMKVNTALSLRESGLEDIEQIADYWFKSSPEYLTAMGVDLEKMPGRESFTKMLTIQIGLPYEKKSAMALIWEVDKVPIGHCNVNEIKYGSEASMHLHIWKPDFRKKGMGTTLVKMSLPFFFQKLDIQILWCEPYALNPAPSKTLERAGFEFVKKYVTIPGSLSFEQEVNRWKMGRAKFEEEARFKFS